MQLWEINARPIFFYFFFAMLKTRQPWSRDTTKATKPAWGSQYGSIGSTVVPPFPAGFGTLKILTWRITYTLWRVRARHQSEFHTHTRISEKAIILHSRCNVSSYACASTYTFTSCVQQQMDACADMRGSYATSVWVAFIDGKENSLRGWLRRGEWEPLGLP